VSPPFEPLPAFACPLCGAANGCAVARSGSFEVDCWCRRATPSLEALARVPAALRARACLCPACLSRSAEPAAAPQRAARRP